MAPWHGGPGADRGAYRPGGPSRDGYTGVAVHRAARICAAARGGQVLVSQATQDVVEDQEEELGFTLVDVGEHRLKDLDRPVRLFQLAAPGLDLVPAARGEAARPACAGGVHGFPALLTSFIGRAGPLAEVTGLLERGRLVTISGPGGSGKTRLADVVARRVAESAAGWGMAGGVGACGRSGTGSSGSGRGAGGAGAAGGACCCGAGAGAGPAAVAAGAG